MFQLTYCRSHLVLADQLVAASCMFTQPLAADKLAETKRAEQDRKEGHRKELEAAKSAKEEVSLATQQHATLRPPHSPPSS